MSPKVLVNPSYTPHTSQYPFLPKARAAHKYLSRRRAIGLIVRCDADASSQLDDARVTVKHG